MPLRSEEETGPSLEETVTHAEPVTVLAAPWAGWFDRKRPRTTWLGFVQALVFYGLLRGLSVHHQTKPDGESLYGVEDQGCVCWFAGHHWHVDSEAGHDLGWNLWRAFLEAGGPRPAEFTLQASVDKALPPGQGETYFRRGGHCRQRWELMRPIERPVWL
jgi:hypothetical protein